MAIFMVMMMASGMAMMATDAKSAADAAKELFERFDYESKCDPFSEEGGQLPEVNPNPNPNPNPDRNSNANPNPNPDRDRDPNLNPNPANRSRAVCNSST